MAYTVILYVASACFILYGIRKHRESKWGKCNNNVKLNGRIVVITGANSGIGYETTKELSRRGARVILACRSSEKADEAMNNIKKELNMNPKLEFIELDLSCFQSIHSFTQEVMKKYKRIDMLINNAGVSYPKTSNLKTTEGFEIHMGVNYLGHVLLTNLLLDHLKEGDKPKIINVSSLLHQKGTLDLEDLNYENRPIQRAYADSKLALTYFGQELAKRNADVNVYNLCPGWVYTNLFRYHKYNFFYTLMALPIAFFFMRSKKQGAETVIYCATEPRLDAETGQFYRNCTKFNSAYQFDDETGRELWDVTTKIIQEKQQDY
ncbi:PREDICTED: retinol dehydrogenase 11-like [Nicrophorus vespilloides]|uniref:Retinol dehydrogenase 11-like n=1 Tax=Nicrophorus vespilloides TaxID=110193 RepID=A0ABM1MSM8_NICVS|nr:PREDICTED: retinol dehydrogenase 11-like [Nicrophorus vespilloides]